MAPRNQELVRHSRELPAERDRHEPRFEHSPWIHITRSERKDPLVTMWIGFKAIVVSISFPDGNPKDIQISITGGCLNIKSATPNHFASQNIELPCAVESRPICIEEGTVTYYILLRKE